MGTISRSENRLRDLLRSSQLRYAAAYILITSAVLFFLNVYAPIMIRRMTFSSQKNAILEKAQLFVSAFSSYDKLDRDNVLETVQTVKVLHTTRVVITDAGARCLYDSLDTVSPAEKTYRLVFYPELVEALEGNDAVNIRYETDQLVTRAAMPIVAYNHTIGAVYLLERDPDQATLISGLQRSILWISVGLTVLVLASSLALSLLFSRRMGKLFVSVRKMHGGDYSARLPERGHDEVAQLGIAFNELAQRLQHSEEVRKQFVSNASHELKTPLASIKLLSDSILQNEMDPATTREFVSDIGSEADRLTRLSAKLLELTRLDTKLVEERTLTSVEPLADRVLRMLTPVARRQGIRLTMQCDPDCRVLAADDDLYQILFNLVENGIKYNTPEGTVSVRAGVSDGAVWISVEDTGVGIPDEEKEHIFERFYRVDKARSRKLGGAGLGLSIVWDMVVRNNGSITVTDRPGGGSRFCLRFPCQSMPEVEKP